MKPAVILGLLALGCAPQPEARADAAPPEIAEDQGPVLTLDSGLEDSAVGDVGCQLADIQLTGCADEAPLPLRDLCAAPAALIFNFYGWCASCHRYLAPLNDLHDRLAPLGLEMIIVISEDAMEAPATVEYCQQISEHFELRGRAVIDPGLEIEARYGGADLIVITDAQGQIIAQTQSTSVEAAEAIIEGLLSD